MPFNFYKVGSLVKFLYWTGFRKNLSKTQKIISDLESLALYL